MSEVTNVLVIGASGNLGRPLLAALLASGRFTVSILTRSTSTATFPPGPTVHRLPYTSASSIAPAFAGVHAVVSCVPGATLEIQGIFIDAALAAGVKRFIPSEFGSNTAESSLVSAFARKRAVVAKLRQSEASMGWSAVITGPFFDRALKLGILGFDLQSRTANLHAPISTPFSATTLRTVGAAVVAILSQPLAGTANRYVYISSFTTTQQQVLAALEKATGAKWSVSERSAREEVQQLSARVEAGDKSAMRGLITAAIFVEGSGSEWGARSETQRLGIGAESVEGVVGDIVAGRL